MQRSQIRFVVLSLLVLLAGLMPGAAAPPTNDVCSGAEVIPSSAVFPYLTAVTDITEATTDGDPPLSSCALDNSFSHSIWYVFTPNDTAFYTISSCQDAPTLTTVPDTFMAIYSSGGGGCAGVTNEVACDDDSCGPNFTQASAFTQLLADTTYYIVVWQYGDTTPAPGNSSVQLRISKASVPINDTGAGVIPLFLNSPQVGSTILAQNDYQLPTNSSCFSGIGQKSSIASGRDVVYTFTAPAAGNYSIKVSYYDNNSGYDLVLYAASSLPTGPSPATVTSCLAAANRNPASSAEEIFCLPMAASQTIYIVVDETDVSPRGSDFLIEVTQCSRESESNNTVDTANPYVFGMEGSITNGSDVDCFALGFYPTNSRAFVMLDGSAAHTPDFDLRILTDAGALIQFDDADNDDPFGGTSPNIAGAPLLGTPTFLQINSKLTSPPSQVAGEPYRIYAVVQPPISSATPEVEPNDTVGQFNDALNNYFYGTLSTNLPPTAPSPSSDVDVYRFDAEAGDLVFLSLDCNPQRGSKAINAQLELLDGDGNRLIKVDDPGTSNTTPPGLAGEALVYRIIDDGYYFARVSISPLATGANGAGDYLLSISKNGFIGCCGVPPASPQLSYPTTLPNGHQLVQLQGATPGVSYRIQTSADLMTWTYLGRQTADVAGLLQVEDSTSPLPAQRFYRAIVP